MKIKKLNRKQLLIYKEQISAKLMHSKNIPIEKFDKYNTILDKIEKRLEKYNLVTSRNVKLFINKQQEDQKLVYGIVYVPNEPDTDNDYSTPDEIEKACHEFMVEFRKFNLQHYSDTELSDEDVSIVENYIAPVDYLMGNQLVKKGSWVVAIKVFNDKVWQDIKDGKYTGFSMEGIAQGD